ncbi:MAG: tetraacyldisaccharide 4'-kinase, partial [Hyphomonadaceae bacterium]
GAEFAEAVPYPDHQPFSTDELAWLEALARERGAALISSEKVHVRLPPHARARVHVLNVAARFADEAALDALLARVR